MFTAASVIGPTPQNITPGNFNALADAILSKTAYGNIHSIAFPAGEIRGALIHGVPGGDLLYSV